MTHLSIYTVVLSQNVASVTASSLASYDFDFIFFCFYLFKGQILDKWYSITLTLQLEVASWFGFGFPT